MSSANGELAPLKVSTHDLPERDRLTLWQDFFAQKIVLANVELLSTDPLRAEATLQVLPGVRAMWLDVSTHLRMERGPAHVSNGDDSFSILVKESGLFSMSQRGLEISLDDGEALAIIHTEPARLISSDACNTTFTVPHNALAPFVKNIEDMAMRRIPRDREALRLLMQYAAMLRARAPLTTPELSHLAATHLRDLIGMALGSTRDGAVIANAGGVRAARLSAIKAHILENLTSPGLTISEVARRQGVTPRYVQMLFESEGITFSKFVRNQRLRRAYSLLLEPRFCDRSVTAIAFAAGFGDLSYFNRCFRRRFGAAPSELRRDICRMNKNDGVASL